VRQRKIAFVGDHFGATWWVEVVEIGWVEISWDPPSHFPSVRPPSRQMSLVSSDTLLWSILAIAVRESDPGTLHQFAYSPPYFTCSVTRATSLELRQNRLPQLELEVATQHTQEDHDSQFSLWSHGSSVTPTRLNLLLPSINVWLWCRC
jgi:hypothetical protein